MTPCRRRECVWAYVVDDDLLMGPFTRIDSFRASNSARGRGPQILSHSGLIFMLVALLYLLNPEDQDLTLPVSVLEPSNQAINIAVLL